MPKAIYGGVHKFTGGAVQYLQQDSGLEFLLVSGRHEDIYIPLRAIKKALEDEWVYENTNRKCKCT